MGPGFEPVSSSEQRGGGSSMRSVQRLNAQQLGQGLGTEAPEQGLAQEPGLIPGPSLDHVGNFPPQPPLGNGFAMGSIPAVSVATAATTVAPRTGLYAIYVHHNSF